MTQLEQDIARLQAIIDHMRDDIACNLMPYTETLDRAEEVLKRIEENSRD